MSRLAFVTSWLHSQAADPNVTGLQKLFPHYNKYYIWGDFCVEKELKHCCLLINKSFQINMCYSFLDVVRYLIFGNPPKLLVIALTYHQTFWLLTWNKISPIQIYKNMQKKKKTSLLIYTMYRNSTHKLKQPHVSYQDQALETTIYFGYLCNRYK